MKTRYDTWRDILRLWRPRHTLSSDLGVPFGTVQTWSARDSVPSHYWHQLVRSAKKRNIRLDSDDLVKLAAAYPPKEKPKGSGVERKR